MEDNSSTERLDRIERSIEALASTAAGFFAQLAGQQAEHQAAHEARMAEHEARMADIQAKHESRLNDHEEVLIDHEAEHRRLLTAQILTAADLRETAAVQKKTEQQLAETTEKLNALIAVVDDFIRRQPKQ